MEVIQRSSLLYECPAETRLTVYRRFSITKKKEQAALHADARDHDKHVFEFDCFEKCACE